MKTGWSHRLQCHVAQDLTHESLMLPGHDPTSSLFSQALYCILPNFRVH